MSMGCKNYHCPSTIRRRPWAGLPRPVVGRPPLWACRAGRQAPPHAFRASGLSPAPRPPPPPRLLRPSVRLSRPLFASPVPRTCALARLAPSFPSVYDSQFGEGDVSDIKQYIKLGKLGEAFTSEEQVVLLIDEIDKADLEFPNDLLWELDRMEFYINETKETIRTKHRPIVIITSNAEKELPDAFLRRCIFHYIDFPDKDKIRDIIRVHYGDMDRKLVENAIKAFYDIRHMRGIMKKPSTSELLDWVQALQISGVDVSEIGEVIPYIGVLLKKNQDIDTVKAYRNVY